MNPIARIDEEVIHVDDFVRTLKLSGQFAGLVEQMVRDKLAVHAARKHGVALTPAEIQERADQFRRVLGLHRAADTNKYFDSLGVTLNEFEAFISENLYQEKMMAQVCSEQAVADYFKLNSPKFDSVEVRHILLDSAGKAREVMSILREDPDSFDAMARTHSIAETHVNGGVIGKVLRGALRTEIESRVFNADRKSVV